MTIPYVIYLMEQLITQDAYEVSIKACHLIAYSVALIGSVFNIGLVAQIKRKFKKLERFA